MNWFFRSRLYQVSDAIFHPLWARTHRDRLNRRLEDGERRTPGARGEVDKIAHSAARQRVSKVPATSHEEPRRTTGRTRRGCIEE